MGLVMSRKVATMDNTARWHRRRLIAQQIADGGRTPDVAAAHGVTCRMVSLAAKEYGVNRPRGKPPAWRECPPELQAEYYRLTVCRRLSKYEARRVLEAVIYPQNTAEQAMNGLPQNADSGKEFSGRGSVSALTPALTINAKDRAND